MHWPATLKGRLRESATYIKGPFVCQGRHSALVSDVKGLHMVRDTTRCKNTVCFLHFDVGKETRYKVLLSEL